MTLAPNAGGWIDVETKVAEAPADHRGELRSWLRRLTRTNLTETAIRREPHAAFGFTLPRFDLLAQLDEADDGLVPGDVSRRPMVSAVNATALADRPIAKGHVTRTPAPHDRRGPVIRTTPEGRTALRAMARERGDRIGDMFGDLDPRDIEASMGLLAKVKPHLRRRLSEGNAP